MFRHSEFRSRAAAAGLALLLGVGVFASAEADVLIRLKDGTVITVPVSLPIKKEDIASIEYQEGPEASSSQSPVESPQPKQQAEPKKAAKPTPAKNDMSAYSQRPPDPHELVKSHARASQVGLPAASSFRDDAFSSTETGDDEEQLGVGRTWRVGPDGDFELPSAAAAAAKSGDIVEIAGGLYLNDSTVWSQSNLIIRGVEGRPHLRLTDHPPNRKAIWVIQGHNVLIENIEFSGAKVPDKNGAGIRHEGGLLTIRGSYFHHNEFAILGANKDSTELVIEGSEFAYHLRNGTWAHGIYMGDSKRLVVRNSYIHHTHRGHHIKSRAAENYILYNRISDENGMSSYHIDISKCGKTVVLGNVMHQGEKAENFYGIAFGTEACPPGRSRQFLVAHNTFVNDRSSGKFIRNRTDKEAQIINNLIVGRTQMGDGPIKDIGNILTRRASFADPASYDFRLVAGSKAIDAGVAVPRAGGEKMVPEFEYRHPLKAVPRRQKGTVDVGAYEFSPDQRTSSR